jgi:hypothetical protein
MHKNTLADAVERLTVAELADLLSGTAARLAARGVFDRSLGTFALDASLLVETTRHDQGAGMTKRIKRKLTRTKAVIEVEQLIWGFTVIILYELELRLVVVLINEHESSYTEALVAQAVANLGPGTIRVLVMVWASWMVRPSGPSRRTGASTLSFRPTTRCRSWLRRGACVGRRMLGSG